jgi:hypothetical protein
VALLSMHRCSGTLQYVLLLLPDVVLTQRCCLPLPLAPILQAQVVQQTCLWQRMCLCTLEIWRLFSRRHVTVHCLGESGVGEWARRRD